MKKMFYPILIAVLCPFYSNSQCNPNVPLYVIDLSQNPDTTWILTEENAHDRFGQCCSATDNENCIQFQITLNEYAAGVYFNYDGAPAYGSLGWQIDCGPMHNLRDTICINGGGTYTLTFCKPGTDNGNYTLISVPRPVFPEDQFVPLNCQRQVHVLGLTNTSVSWESVSPGVPGEYNYLLSCTDCTDPVYTPDPEGPNEVEFKVCGYPILDHCVGEYDFCDNVKFTNLDAISMNISPASPMFCPGGSVTLNSNAFGGDNNFTYTWFDQNMNVVGNGSSMDISVAGTYTCTAHEGNFDVNMCNFATQSVIVKSAPVPTYSYVVQNVNCHDGNTGMINVTPSGGTAPYTFNWSNGATTEDLAGISSGNYSLVISDANHCTSNNQMSIIVEESSAVLITDITIHCPIPGSQYANVDISASGGNPNYSISFNGGQTFEPFGMNSIPMPAGQTHEIVVQDINNCVSSVNAIEIDEVVKILDVSFNTCYVSGQESEDISVNVTGGTPGYTISVNNGVNFGLLGEYTLNVPINSNYNIVAQDKRGCSSEAVDIKLPDILRVNAEVSSDYHGYGISCSGLSDGEITAIPSGGIAGYTIEWNNGCTSGVNSNLSAGSYEVSITDSHGCKISDMVLIKEPQPLSSRIHVMSDFSGQDVSCNGMHDGEAILNANGGVLPYVIEWSNGDSGPSIDNLIAGIYSATVTDINGCKTSDKVTLSQPDEITLNLTAPVNNHSHHIDLNGGNDGSIDASVAGGSEPYSFQWSNGSSDEDVSQLPAGTYHVIVTDANGCKSEAQITLTEPFKLELPSAFSPNNDGNNDSYIIRGIEAYPDNTITVINRWGNVVFETDDYSNMNAWNGETSANGELLPDGVYFLILEITDTSGDINKSTYVQIKTH